MDLETAVKSTACRKLGVSGTSRQGRYWLACPKITIKDRGNGWDAPEEVFVLRLQHLENGKVEAVVQRQYSDQRNQIKNKTDFLIHGLLKSETIEDVIVELKKGVSPGEINGEVIIIDCFDDYYAEDLSKSLSSLGMEQSRPGPDEPAEE